MLFDVKASNIDMLTSRLQETFSIFSFILNYIETVGTGFAQFVVIAEVWNMEAFFTGNLNDCVWLLLHYLFSLDCERDFSHIVALQD
jgi:hypothetical protein